MILEGTIQIPFRFAAGKGASRFLVALRDSGALLASRCEPCGQVLCPARSFCPHCGEELQADTEVGPQGTLISWTEIPGRGYFGLVRLDGAHTSLLHRIIAPGQPPKLGDRVKARMAAERTGSILDLEGFELLPPSEEKRP